MIVLGIDPGSRNTGWGLLAHEGSQTRHVASGTLKLGSTKPLPERLAALARDLDAMLAEHQPEVCAVERVFSARNAHSALVLGHARGVVLAAVARSGIEIFEYSATQVKQAVTATGGADKSQVGRMVQVLLGHPGALGEDEADALALALTHAAHARMAKLG